MTSEDVKFSYERIQNPDVGSGAAGPFNGILVEAPDDYTIRLVLPGPDAAIFQVLARQTPLSSARTGSRAALIQIGDDGHRALQVRGPRA